MSRLDNLLKGFLIAQQASQLVLPVISSLKAPSHSHPLIQELISVSQEVFVPPGAELSSDTRARIESLIQILRSSRAASRPELTRAQP